MGQKTRLAWRMVPLIALLSGCAFRQTGLVSVEDQGIKLALQHGGQLRVASVGAGVELASLEGHLVEVTGRRAFGRVTVQRWTVRAGLHDMNAWVGTLARRGAQLGIDDRNTGLWYFIDRADEGALMPLVGRLVVVEGVVVGPHVIEVRDVRVIAPR